MKIGEFAEVCRTKISVLRHYDKENLLKPTYIDKFTGYRYYSQEQIALFLRITALKQAGFSLAEIRELLGQLRNDSDLLEFFEKKRTFLLETLANLEKAKELIIGGLNQMDVLFQENAHGLWASYIYELTNNPDEIREQFEHYLVANDYQRISAIESDTKKRLLKCRVVKLNLEVSTLQENLNLPFENDETVVGKWETIGEYAVKEEFYQELKSRQNWYYAYPQAIYFLPKGEYYWCYGWTKGKLLVHTGDTATVNEYEIETRNGEHYMFVSFKSYEYRKGGAPRILVLKQIDNRPYTANELAKKDNLDMPFIEDPKVLGKWKVFDFLRSRDEFSPVGSGEPPIFFKEIEFFAGGSCTSIYGQNTISGDHKQVWTKGYVLRKFNSTACAYEILTVDDRDYLIIEWKSGDYRWGGLPTDYYVFVRA